MNRGRSESNQQRQTGRQTDRQNLYHQQKEEGVRVINRNRRADRQILYHQQKEEGVRVINRDLRTDRYCTSRKRKALNRETDRHPPS